MRTENYTFAVYKNSISTPIFYRIMVGKKMVARMFNIEEGDFTQKRVYMKRVNGGTALEKIEKEVKVKSKIQKKKLVLVDTLIELSRMIMHNGEGYRITCTKDDVISEPQKMIEELFIVMKKRNSIDESVNNILGLISTPDTPKNTESQISQKSENVEIPAASVSVSVNTNTNTNINDKEKEKTKVGFKGTEWLDVVKKQQEIASNLIISKEISEKTKQQQMESEDKNIISPLKQIEEMLKKDKDNAK